MVTFAHRRASGDATRAGGLDQNPGMCGAGDEAQARRQRRGWGPAETDLPLLQPQIQQQVSPPASSTASSNP